MSKPSQKERNIEISKKRYIEALELHEELGKNAFPIISEQKFLEKTRQSQDRYLKALKAGRKPGREGGVPYLEKQELEDYKSELIKQTLFDNYIKYGHAAKIVWIYLRLYL
jgi:hypothetical protein